MEREAFTAFVAQVLQDVVVLAEEKTARRLPPRLAFQWLGKNHPERVTQNIPEYIMQRVYIDAEHIYPCVDIEVGDLLEDGTLLIVGNIAGYPPRAFQRNWTGRPGRSSGPFVYVVGAPLLARLEGKAVRWTPESGSFGFITPKVPQEIQEGPVYA